MSAKGRPQRYHCILTHTQKPSETLQAGTGLKISLASHDGRTYSTKKKEKQKI